jgi:hypothetical protein
MMSKTNAFVISRKTLTKPRVLTTLYMTEKSDKATMVLQLYLGANTSFESYSGLYES